ncbi:glycoside hydrolase family 30 protein [Diplocarpon rosae]|nr:glycoside hydrolase family 30 protein [Diplocarpon rosae]
MLGFGHTWTDSTVSTFGSLEEDVFDKLMADLFGPDGNNMGFMRHTIGSSDMSGSHYSFDDNGPHFNQGQPDMNLDNFALGPDGTAMAEMIAKMGHYKSDVFLLGSPWSYPGWMKQNGLYIAPKLLGSGQILNNTFDPQFTAQAVQYFIKYVDAYRELGVQVNGLSLSNEPLNSQGGYPCMQMGPDDAARILNTGLGDAMKERGVKVIAYDHNTDQPFYPARVIQGTANGTIDGAAWHCYAGNLNYTVLEHFHQAFPSIPQFMTECSSYLPSDASIWMAQQFLPAVQSGASGDRPTEPWLTSSFFRVLGTDPDYGPHSPWGGCEGCVGSIMVNSSTTYTKTHDYYMMGQFSRFIRRGSRNYVVRQGIEYGAGTTEAPQFLLISIQNPDESWAIVFLNNYGTDQDVELSFVTHPESVWYGTIPDLTVVTWLIPPASLWASNGTAPATASSSWGNSTATASATSGTNSSSKCPPLKPTSSESATPLPPVPFTDYVPPRTLKAGQCLISACAQGELR